MRGKLFIFFLKKRQLNDCCKINFPEKRERGKKKKKKKKSSEHYCHLVDSGCWDSSDSENMRALRS